MASAKVQAFLERTKRIKKTGEQEPSPEKEENPSKIQLESISRDRSPTFSGKETFSTVSPSSQTGVIPIPERVPKPAFLKKVPISPITPKSDLFPPRSNQRKPPKSAERRVSPGRSSSAPKTRRSSGRGSRDISFDKEQIPVIENLLLDLSQSREALDSLLQSQFSKEKRLIELLKSAKKKENTPRKRGGETQEDVARIEE